MIFDKPEVLLRDKCERLEKQLAERDAALARCVEALQKASYALFQIKRMVPEAIKEHAIKACDAACEVLNNLPTSAQATAKVLVAARAYDAAISEMEREHKRPDLYFTQHSTLTPLRLAIREEQEWK